MAQALLFVCNSCGKSVQAWSDGNPYFIDESGEKQYAYHPDHDRLALCIGNDTPHLCLKCGEEFKVDSRSPVDRCPLCSSSEISPTFELGGKRCPCCEAGVFVEDPEFHCIS